MIDTQPLAILREIDRAGNLTAAAEKLGLTQSAASHAVRRFEERHQVSLWQKDGRGIRLTQVGQYLLTVANRILPQLDHAETVLGEFSRGRRGALRIGMECHPCQQWLMRIVEPFYMRWPDVDLDVTTAFQFGGLAALLGHEIDVLITPDPIARPNLKFVPVFDYELVLAVHAGHVLANRQSLQAGDLHGEVLVTYPVARERLDIYTQFLVPNGELPRRHRVVETTDMMMALVATGRAVSALPNWLAKDSPNINTLRIGSGIFKSIHVGMRSDQAPIDYLSDFIALAQGAT